MAIPKSFHEMMADKMGAAGDPSDDGDEGGPDYDAGYRAAVGAFIDAVHSKDVDEAAAQLESAIKLCEQKDGDEPPADDEHAGGGGHAALLLIPHGKGH